MVITVTYNKGSQKNLTKEYTLEIFESAHIIPKGTFKIQDNSYSKVLKNIYDDFYNNTKNIVSISFNDTIYSGIITNIKEILYQFTFKNVPSEYLIISFGE